MHMQSRTPPNHMLALPHSDPQCWAICCGCAQWRGCVCRLRCTSSAPSSAAHVALNATEAVFKETKPKHVAKVNPAPV